MGCSGRPGPAAVLHRLGLPTSAIGLAAPAAVMANPPGPYLR
jgi:hypothetical protein